MLLPILWVLRGKSSRGMRVFHRYLLPAFEEGRGRLFWIVGSFPSVLIHEQVNGLDEERDVDYFYGAYRNRFWKTMAGIVSKRGGGQCDLVYGFYNVGAVLQRREILSFLGLGITDIYAEVETEGKASDQHLSVLAWNPYLRDVLSSPTRVVLATSRLVERELRRCAQQWGSGVRVVVLPSPSPRSLLAGYSDEGLLVAYERVFVDAGILS